MDLVFPQAYSATVTRCNTGSKHIKDSKERLLIMVRSFRFKIDVMQTLVHKVPLFQFI